MCGICAGIGKHNQIASVIDGLKKLEYRGYDSSGIAYIQKKKINILKSVGEIKNLEEKVPENIFSNIVIGHTRWATHGKVCYDNSHPHFSADKSFAIVHNGIIENYEELREKYLKDINLVSETDTEIFVNLISIQDEDDVFSKLRNVCKIIKGSFAVALLSKNDDKIFLAKRNSPLIVAQNSEGSMAGSDISVFEKMFEKCYVLDDDEFAILTKYKIEIFDKNGKKIDKNPVFLREFELNEEFLHEKYFMLKEIKEQPIVLKKTYFNYFSQKILSKENLLEIAKFKSFHFIACGTAYHSALMGARYIQQIAQKECQCSVASEFRYNNNIFNKNCLYIFVSQSGETADTIACAKLVKDKGLKTMCVTNVPYCSLNKLADYVLPTFAGKEIAVASTKAYTAQVFTILILAIFISNNKNLQDRLKKFIFNFEIQEFDDEIFKEIFKFKKVYFIGREQDYVTSLEASLKLKEIAYVNCIAVPAGELKHGTLALVDEDTIVVVTSTQEKLKSKTESTIQEIKARKGNVLLISNFKHSADTDYSIVLPNFDELLMPIVSIVVLQNFAFLYSVKLGLNPDKPRNLAKSVTVE